MQVSISLCTRFISMVLFVNNQISTLLPNLSYAEAVLTLLILLRTSLTALFIQLSEFLSGIKATLSELRILAIPEVLWCLMKVHKYTAKQSKTQQSPTCSHGTY